MSENHSEQSVELKFEDYQALAKKLANQFKSRVTRRGFRIDYDEAYSEVCLLWVKARDGFKPERGSSFATYWIRCVVYEVKIYIAKLKDQREERNAVFLDKDRHNSQHNHGSDSCVHDLVEDSSARSQFDVFAFKQASWIIKGRTPLLGKLLDLTASEHDELQAELDAAQAQRAYAQSLGINVDSRFALPTTLTPKVLAEVFRFDWKVKERVRDEIEEALDHVG